MSEDVFPDAESNRIPEYEFKNGYFYCDGVKVLPYQLTEEEIRRFIPKAYWSAYLRGKFLLCPFDGCQGRFESGLNAKRSWTTHVRNAHKNWYEKWHENMQKCNTYNDFVIFVESTLSQTNPHE